MLYMGYLIIVGGYNTEKFSSQSHLTQLCRKGKCI